MIELAPHIFYINGKNNSRFPYCACLYLKGRRMRVLIDAGMGADRLAAAKSLGIDLLILTHCHIDHRLTRSRIVDVPVWCHEKEAIFLADREHFFSSAGLQRSGLDLTRHFDFGENMFGLDIDHTLVDGERIDLGGMTLETIHTPGHTPGHLAFFVPEAGFLFTGDVDLSSFGPFYGHDFADIDDFLKSIRRLKKIGAGAAASGHAGPFQGNLTPRFDAYEDMIYQRDRLLLEKLTVPKSVQDFRAKNLFYRSYPDFPQLIQWFEWVHIEKHLLRLAGMGQVCQEGDCWTRC